MEPFSFIHTADLHLDSPFTGVSEVAPDIAENLREATFRSFASVVDACMRHQVDFLLVAGDIFESRDRSLRAQLAFRDGLKRLSDAGIRSYIVHGNHDPLGGWSASIRFPELAHVFPGGSVSTEHVVRDSRTIAVVHGVSYNTREVRENLTIRFPKQKEDMFSIGLLHCNVDNKTSHDNYAPCSVGDLSASGMDYWALGHVHAREVLRESDPVIVYPGNTQGRDPGETGARGCYLVRVDSSRKAYLTFLATDRVRWETAQVDLTNAGTDQDLLNILARTCNDMRERAEGRPVVCRLSLTGRTPLFQHLARPGYLPDVERMLRESEGKQDPFVWVERLELAARLPADADARRNAPDLLGSALRKIGQYRDSPQALGTLRDIFGPLEEATSGWRAVSEPKDDDLLRWLEMAEARLLEELGAE